MPSQSSSISEFHNLHQPIQRLIESGTVGSHLIFTLALPSSLQQLPRLHQLPPRLSLLYLLFYLAFRGRQSFFFAILLWGIWITAPLQVKLS